MTQPTTTPTPQRHAIIIGAGPAGLSVAGLLAQHGWRCTIYEAWSEPHVAQTSFPYLERAYGLSCQKRVLRVLQRLNALPDVLQAGGYWREATYRHDAQVGAVEMFSKTSSSRKNDNTNDDDDDDDDDISKTLSCLRTELMAGLLAALRRQWNHQIQIHWECPVQGLVMDDDDDDDDPQVCVVVADQKHHADVIICADGANSPVGRTYLQTLDPSIAVTTEPSGFSSRTILLKDDVLLNTTTTTTQPWIPRPNSLHVILSPTQRLLLLARHAGPRPSALAVQEFPLQMMMIYPNTHAQLASLHLTATTLESVLTEAFTQTQLPLRAVATDDHMRLCAETAGRPLPGTVQCSQYHSHNVVLIGDAAHCVPTNNAQGVNVAMEDAEILAELLVEPNKDQEDDATKHMAAQLAQFTRIRKPEMDALQRMLRHPFYESTRRTWRARVVTRLHQGTGIAAFRPMTEQVYRAQCSLVTCERHMLVQYHVPVVLVGLAVVMGGYWLVLVVKHLFGFFFARASKVY